MNAIVFKLEYCAARSCTSNLKRQEFETKAPGGLVLPAAVAAVVALEPRKDRGI